MPIVRTALKAGTTTARKTAIVQAIHDGLVTGIGMPQEELFNLVSEYPPEDFHYSRSFNNIRRSDDVVMVEITMRRGRSDAMKRALYAAIADNLEGLGVDRRDALIFVHENDHSDWSVGNGVFAMNIVQNPGSDFA